MVPAPLTGMQSLRDVFKQTKTTTTTKPSTTKLYQDSYLDSMGTAVGGTRWQFKLRMTTAW